MKPLNRANLKKLNAILTDIESKELEHDQTVYYCGTAACLAGWYMYYHVMKPNGTPVDHMECAYENEEYSEDPWDYAKDSVSLNAAEAYCLFDCKVTLEFQRCVMDNLLKGHRLPPVISDLVFTKAGVTVPADNQHRHYLEAYFGEFYNINLPEQPKHAKTP